MRTLLACLTLALASTSARAQCPFTLDIVDVGGFCANSPYLTPIIASRSHPSHCAQDFNLLAGFPPAGITNVAYVLFGLRPINVPIGNCSLFCPPDLIFPLSQTSGSAFNICIALPPDTGLIGLSFCTQAIVERRDAGTGQVEYDPSNLLITTIR